ncbi:MAG: primosomal protein N' [Oscillibacter sp.]|nr:primosomal protein N' [Oscillibacter sp.]
MKFADVIVPLAVEGFYTYSVPAALENGIREGTLVIVPFAGNKKYTAMVCRVHETEPSGYKIRAIESVMEREICFSATHLRFLLWLSEYYMAFAGDVLRAALPVVFRLESFTCISREDTEIDFAELTANEQSLLNFLQPGQYTALKDIEKSLGVKNCVGIVRSLLAKGYVRVKETIDDVFREKTEKWIRWARLRNENELGELLDGLKRAPAQYALLCRWIEAGGEEKSKTAFLAETGASPAVLKALCDKGILAIEEKRVSRLREEVGEPVLCNALSEQQEKAMQAIRAEFGKKDCVLLQGVTSSGKTEVYIHLIQEAIRQGKQVLYMLPEIALTVQIIRRLQRVFGDTVGIYHSGMPDAMRAELWKKQCSGQPCALILGVRSSIFLPFQNLGLIIVDEEHDASYKQKEPSPRYQARDAAIMLAKMHGAKILLGSATPSFESYENARSGKYGFVTLTQRYGNIRMPQLILADLAEYRRKKLMKGVFTPVLYEEMKKVLDAGMQVILFQNRRGYSTYLRCDHCGVILKCKHCDVSMTYYKQRGIMSCRYCGALSPVQEVCGSCGTGHYKICTPGTEKIEEEVTRLFPGVRVARMDLEVMSSRARYRAVIDDFEQGRIQVLIGTQMVSKGLDFERVKLVGVIDADSMINFPDFRAEERAYCMLMQVSGRSGRKGEQGKVVIQTGEVKNRIFPMLLSADYDSFYTELAEERQFFAYPPFCRLIRVELRHKDVGVVRNAANRLARELRERLGKRVCGPAVPEVGRINNFYRIHILLKIESGVSFSKVKQLLKMQSGALLQLKEYSAVRIICDVDA